LLWIRFRRPYCDGIVTDAQSGALHAKRYLIIDRDTNIRSNFGG